MPESARDQEALFDLGVEAFNRGDFFQAHELWEEIWVQSQPPARRFMQALIHFAVGYYHHCRHNQQGAVRQFDKGLRKCAGCEPDWRGIRMGPLAAKVLLDRGAIADGGGIEAFPRIERTEP